MRNMSEKVRMPLFEKYRIAVWHWGMFKKDLMCKRIRLENHFSDNNFPLNDNLVTIT